MRKIISIFLVLLSAQIAYAALAPKYQNSKDLGVLVEFINEHDRVLSRLNSIDFDKKSVHFDNHCIAVFGRVAITNPQGWVGPAAALEFKSSNCKID